ncbi:MAG: alpha/beta hydrolase [Acholeplasmataceae bacterium]|jgi:pimeloyl-ACP methyl ester carboxylesterase
MKKTFKYILTLSLLIISIISLVGCKEKVEPELSYDKQEMVLVGVDKEVTITLTVKPDDANYTINIDKENVATAIKDGKNIKITGVSPGRALMVVTHENKDISPLFISLGVIAPDIDLTVNKKTIKLPNGETYAYLEENPEASKTVLLLHGNISSSVFWLRAIKELKDDYHILAPDFRGFGDSSYKTRITSFTDLVNDIVSFLELKGVSSAYVIGWSMGGAVAMKLAATHPTLVEKLVLVASTTHKGYPTLSVNAMTGEKTPFASAEDMANDVAIGAGLQIFLTDDRKTMKDSLKETAYNVFPDNELELYVTEALKQRNLLDANWALATFNMSNTPNAYTEGTNTIKDITCPVLHLWGKKDDILSPKYMTDDNYLALQNVSERIDYDDCGHLIVFDKTKQAINDIKTFLNK